MIDPIHGGSYEQLLQERLVLGRTYMDYLSHLNLTAPQAILLFRRVLHLDSLLSQDARYGSDHLDVVSVAEDARFHQPPEAPVDDDVAPCRLCTRRRTGIDVDIPLPNLAPREAA